jgi:hypothetical protein
MKKAENVFSHTAGGLMKSGWCRLYEHIFVVAHRSLIVKVCHVMSCTHYSGSEKWRPGASVLLAQLTA